MSLKKINILTFICLFPVFTIRSNLNFFEISYISSIFLLPFFFFNYFILKKKTNSSLFYLYIGIIITLGIDENLGLWNGIIQPYRYELIKFFKIIYIPGIWLLFTISIVITYLISRSSEKFINVIIVFLLSIFLFNIFDKTKSHTNIKDYTKLTSQNYQKTELIIIFDEMSGLNSHESQTPDGMEFDKIAKELYDKFNFEYYSKAYSNSPNSVTAISSLVNFSNKNFKGKTKKVSKNYFYDYELIKNLFFQKYNNISVYQNIHIDYCHFKNIKKCKTHNPFKKEIYLEGYKNNSLTKIFSLWKLNGSIISTLFWRSLRELRIIDSNLEPEGQKAAFNNFFKNLEKDIYSKKYDLIFAHTLVPHKPYGFDKNCKYDGKLSLRNTFYSKEEEKTQHNIERKCVFMFLNKFLTNLKNKNFLDKVNLTIMSDHGARIKNIDESYLSVIYAYRDEKTKTIEIKEKVISQELFLKKYN